MVTAVRRGRSLRRVAREFQVSLKTVQRWVARAGTSRLDRVDFTDRPAGPPRPANRILESTETLILTIRKELRDFSPLGEFGDLAIREELRRQGTPAIPSTRTIARVLLRSGSVDRRRRIRRPSPPPGWYLPEVVARRAEIDSFDVVTGLVIRGGIDVEVLNVISIHGSLPDSWPRQQMTAKIVTALAISHWRSWGLPHYAQFDNDTLFQGPHQHRDVVGRVMRLCLSLNVVPVFAPPREPGFQNAIESFNGLWQDKVWSRFEHDSITSLQQRSTAYVLARRRRNAIRIGEAPSRNTFPDPWSLDLQAHPSGGLIFIRRTSDRGSVSLLGRTFPVDSHWLHRLVRADVNLDTHSIKFHALRRSEPDRQPLLAEIPYSLPHRRFQE